MVIRREQLYGGPMARGKRFHYVAYLKGEQVATGETKEACAMAAETALLGAFQCASNQPIVSIAADGTICSTREYAPGEVEFVYHRNLSGVCSCMESRLELDGRRVSVREFHEHYVNSYNAAVSTAA